eukprot:scaffold68296_cov32-Tisochrysis_lutea.AAC.3
MLRMLACSCHRRSRRASHSVRLSRCHGPAHLLFHSINERLCLRSSCVLRMRPDPDYPITFLQWQPRKVGALEVSAALAVNMLSFEVLRFAEEPRSPLHRGTSAQLGQSGGL